MKHLCRFCAAIALACAFTLPALAGEMHTGVAPPPPPPPSLSAETADAPSVELGAAILAVLDAVISFR